MTSNFWKALPSPRGLDPLYFNRRRSLEGALSRYAKPVHRIIDVGAHIGDTVIEFAEWFPDSEILAFEPLPASFSILFDRVDKSLPARRVRFLRQVGLSDSTGTRHINTSRSQPNNSSLRPLNYSSTTAKSHRGLNIDTPSIFEKRDLTDVFTVEIELTTLDRHLSDPNKPESRWLIGDDSYIDLLKIDTQGWDFYVLRGATESLKKTKAVLLEWQLDDIYGPPVPLYELDRLMSQAGFYLWDVSHVYKDLASLRTLWMDLLYVRRAQF